MAENEKIEAVVQNESAKPVAAAKSENAKPVKKKDSVFKRIGNALGKFWREYKSELKKIVWYDRKSTIRSTFIVLVAILSSAVVLGVIDFALAQGILALGKLI